MKDFILANYALKQRIMRRVYAYWFMKSVLPALLLQGGALVMLLVGIHEYVSVKFVSTNALSAVSGFGSLITFVKSAYSHTEFISRVLFGASLLFGALVTRDLVRVWKKTLRGESQVRLAKESMIR